MKKIIIVILIVLVCILGGIGIYMLNRTDDTSDIKTNKVRKNTQNSMEQQNNKQINGHENNNNTNNYKIAVIYFSATGTTEKIAKYISDETNADLIKIEPKEPYTSADLNYNSDCRANREQNDENSRPEIRNKIDIENYDIIYLGYPIWWGTCPKIIFTLLDNYDLSEKTVIPFCTSGGSSIAQSLRDLKEYKANVNWLEGKKFDSSNSNSEIEKWINDLDV